MLSCGLCWGTGGVQPVAGKGRPCPQKPQGHGPLCPHPSPREAKTGDLTIQVLFIYEECILVTVIKGHIKAESKTRMQPRGAQSVLGLFPSALGVAPGPRPTQSLHVSKGNSFEQRQFSQVITQNAQQPQFRQISYKDHLKKGRRASWLLRTKTGQESRALCEGALSLQSWGPRLSPLPTAEAGASHLTLGRAGLGHFEGPWAPGPSSAGDPNTRDGAEGLNVPRGQQARPSSLKNQGTGCLWQVRVAGQGPPPPEDRHRVPTSSLGHLAVPQRHL